MKQQTTLAKSIQRKKDRLKGLYRVVATHSSNRMRNISKGMIRAIEEEIAEDEKLLQEEKEIIINSFKQGFKFMTVDRIPLEDICERFFSENYTQETNVKEL